MNSAKTETSFLIAANMFRKFIDTFFDEEQERQQEKWLDFYEELADALNRERQCRENAKTFRAVGAEIVLIKLHNIIHVAKSGKKGLLITHFVFITPCAQEGQGVRHFANQSSLHKAKSASFETCYCFIRLWFRDNVVLFLRN